MAKFYCLASPVWSDRTPTDSAHIGVGKALMVLTMSTILARFDGGERIGRQAARSAFVVSDGKKAADPPRFWRSDEQE